MAFAKKKIPLQHDEVLLTRTYKYRVRRKHFGFLNARARNVDFVWNTINRVGKDQLKNYGYFLTRKDCKDFVSGASKEAKLHADFSIFLHSQSYQLITTKYFESRISNKSRGAKIELNYRHDRDWIPFQPRDVDVKVAADGQASVRYCGRLIDFKLHRNFPNGKLCASNFKKDIKGNWYVCLTFDEVRKSRVLTGNRIIGIDPNIKENDQIAGSNGEVWGRQNLSVLKERETNRIHRKIYRLKFDDTQRELLARKKELTSGIYSETSEWSEEKKCEARLELTTIRNSLKEAWQSRLKKLQGKQKHELKSKLKKLYKTLSKIEYKYANKRREYQHVLSRQIVNKYSKIFIGDGLGKNLAKTNMARSFMDLAIYQFKTMVKYKAMESIDGICEVNIDEKGSTVSCSKCLSKTGPKGLSELNRRRWTCSRCGHEHLRDRCAAENIRNVGQDLIKWCPKEKNYKLVTEGLLGPL